MSPRLLALLKFFKSDVEFTGWEQIPQVLGDLYHPNMTFEIAFGHLLAAYREAAAEPRFQISSDVHGVESLLLAPIHGHHALGDHGMVALNSKATVEEFYGAVIWQIRDILTCYTNIGWCRDLIYPNE